MSYARGDRLGFFGVDDIAAASAVASGASRLLGAVSGLFGGGGKTDQERLARANFFRDAALLGSVTAARYILGGLQNTASHEIPYYNAARDALKATATGQAALNQAVVQGALWAAGIPDPGGTQSMVDNVKRDLQALQVAPPVTSTPYTPTYTPTPTYPATNPFPSVLISGGGATRLPGMTTTAPFNYTPVLIGAGAIALALALRGGRRA